MTADPRPCDSTWVGGFDVALFCVREAGHPMPHRDDCGTTWDGWTAPESRSCAQGKHDACSGDAWDHTEDALCACTCRCHP